MGEFYFLWLGVRAEDPLDRVINDFDALAAQPGMFLGLLNFII